MREVTRSLIVDAALLTLCASAPVVIERVQGLEHAASDLLALFIPNLAWWWSSPRLLGGWNPWIFGGFPANADPLIGLLHPLGLVYALAPPLKAAALDGILSSSAAAVGMLVYLHVTGCGRLGRLIGAISFGLGGFVASHAPHPPLLHAALAIPWAMAAIEALAGLRLVAGLGAATAAILLSGHPQVIVYALTVVVLYAVWLGRPATRGRAAALAGGMVLGIGLAAGASLPALQLIQSSTHALGGGAAFVAPPTMTDPDRLSLIHLVGLLVPFASGGAVGPLYGASSAQSGCGITECTGYPGMIVWLAILVGAPALLRDRRGRFWLVVALLGLFLATGMTGSWPPVGTVRSTARLLLWWNLAAAALAALALGRSGQGASDHPHAPGPNPRSWLLGACVLAGLIAWAGVSGTVPQRSAAVSAGVLAMTALALSIRRLGINHATGRSLVMMVAAADLIAFGASMPFGIASPESSKGIQILERISETTEKEASLDARLSRAAVLPFSWNTNWASLRGARLIQGYNVLVPETLARLLGHNSSSRWIELGWIGDPGLAAPSSHVLDLLRCRIIAAVGGRGDPLGRAIAAEVASGGARWKAVAVDEDWPTVHRVYVNTRARPVAWLVPRVLVVQPEEALELVRGLSERGMFDPTDVALATSPIPGVTQITGITGDATLPTPPPVAVLDYGEDLIRLAAEPNGDALLVTSELAYPGWTATVDGRPSTVHTVNAGFRAVVVPAGRHEILFAYRPWIARLGLTVSAISLVILVFAFVVGRARRDC